MEGVKNNIHKQYCEAAEGGVKGSVSISTWTEGPPLEYVSAAAKLSYDL